MNFRPLWLLPLVLAGAVVPAHAQDGQWFDRADRNGDGQVTRAEFMAFRSANFDRMDRNDDGVLSESDFSMLAKLRPGLLAEMRERSGALDRNGDGKVTRAELASAPAQAFDEADSNRDDVVTKAETAAARQRAEALGKRR